MIKLVGANFSFARLSILLLPAAFACAVQTHAQSKERFEVTSIKAVRVPLAKAVAALKMGNTASARASWEDFETGWRGVEFYLETRDKDMLTQENMLRVKIFNGLGQSKPNASALAADAQTLLVKYDAQLASIAKARPLIPLFDDVARLRMFRAQLHDLEVSLRAGDFAAARLKVNALAEKIDTVSTILEPRSPQVLPAVLSGIEQLRTEFQAATPDTSKALSTVAGITAKYNVVLNQITVEARNSQAQAKK